ncbi:MAG: MazG nucleotide pyrophosphohydrolase domain-containing protein [Candidatus Aenigmatarchaeota archaeon]
MELKDMIKEIHKNAKEKGFWDGKRNFLEALMLIVSEAGECCEAYRKDDWDNVKEELADIVIRTLDLAEGFNIDIENEILKKMEYNKTRPYKHNKKC